MAKIKVKNPVVELDGDEMTRIIWAFIKDKLILPYLDIDLKYYDLGIENRDETDDQDHRRCGQRHQGSTASASSARPSRQMKQRVEEFGLKKMWRSPNGTIRNILGGTVFREPIICRTCRAWCRAGPSPSSSAVTPSAISTAPPTSACPAPASSPSRFEPADGSDPIEREVFDFPGGGVAMAMYNLDDSIRGLCTRLPQLRPATLGYPVYLSTKNTILKAYDGRFKDLFQEVFEAEFAKVR